MENGKCISSWMHYFGSLLPSLRKGFLVTLSVGGFTCWHTFKHYYLHQLEYVNQGLFECGLWGFSDLSSLLQMGTQQTLRKCWSWVSIMIQPDTFAGVFPAAGLCGDRLLRTARRLPFKFLFMTSARSLALAILLLLPLTNIPLLHPSTKHFVYPFVTMTTCQPPSPFSGHFS